MPLAAFCTRGEKRRKDYVGGGQRLKNCVQEVQLGEEEMAGVERAWCAGALRRR